MSEQLSKNSFLPKGKTRSLMDVSSKTNKSSNPRKRQLKELQSMLVSLEATMSALRVAIDELKPNYHRALNTLARVEGGGESKKHNLILHGIAQESLEVQMASEPVFCRDVLETRVKAVFREHLRIARDMPLNHVYRINLGNNATTADMVDTADTAKAAATLPPPILVSFKSVRDKECILQHSKLLRRVGILITEDFSGHTATMAANPRSMGSPTKSKNKKGNRCVSNSSDYTVSSQSSGSVITD